MTQKRNEHAAVVYEPECFAYTRAAALADGVLIDVTTTANDVDIRCPVAVTAAVWSQCVQVPDGLDGEDEDGRLWDVVWMLRHAIRERKAVAGPFVFQLYLRTDDRTRRLVTLKAVCGPGDGGEPCITVMLPDED
jgi:hypothetical protein